MIDNRSSLESTAMAFGALQLGIWGLKLLVVARTDDMVMEDMSNVVNW